MHYYLKYFNVNTRYRPINYYLVKYYNYTILYMPGTLAELLLRGRGQKIAST